MQFRTHYLQLRGDNMIPTLNRNPFYRIGIPDMSGGLNLRDGISLVNDNQLTDAVNVWYKNGVLQTRPRLKESENSTAKVYVKNESLYVNELNNTRINGKLYFLQTEVFENPNEDKYIVEVKYKNSTDEIFLGEARFSEKVTCLTVTHRGNVYIYVNGSNLNEIYIIQRISEGKYKEPKKIEDKDIYAPLVLTNCLPCYNTSGNAGALLQRGATQVEGFNLLGNRYKIEGSTLDNSELGRIEVKDSEGVVIDTVSYMEYGLPYTTEETPGEIVLTYTGRDGTTTRHTVSVPTKETPTVESEESFINSKDQFRLHAYIRGDVCHVTLNKSSEAGNYEPDYISVVYYVNNNMIIEAPCANTTANFEKVTAMTRAIWYGNTSLGINGGSRLFLCGNTKDSEKALVIWSDFENPLYFSENNYVYVGDKSQKVTAFGKQGSNLIIFKESEIYTTQYTQGDVTAEQLEEQQVIDVTTQMAYFPMSIVHSYIGCDCPETVQLCRNKLVFTNSSGKVYTITAQNQYSERNVYEVSEMISEKLKTEDLKKATAVDWDGKYILFVGSKAYVMDYNSYGFENISSYTKQGDANMLLPWFYWEFPISIKNAVVLNGVIEIAEVIMPINTDEYKYIEKNFTIDGTTGRDILYDINETESILREQNIYTMLQTKIFDFNDHSTIKNIMEVHIAFGNNQNIPVAVEFLNETGMIDRQIVTVNGAETTLKQPSHVINRRLIPFTRLCARFGVKIVCEGRLEIDAMTITYKKAGGIK